MNLKMGWDILTIWNKDIFQCHNSVIGKWFIFVIGENIKVNNREEKKGEKQRGSNFGEIKGLGYHFEENILGIKRVDLLIAY